MMRAVVLLIAVIALLSGTCDAKKPKWHELAGYTFEQYAKDFKKPYHQEDLTSHFRKGYFAKNMAIIKEINGLATTWKAGVNMFTDMHEDEFRALNGFKKVAGDNRGDAQKVIKAPEAGAVPLPKEVDWRTANSPRVLTAVKHQGACGSCWAHSAAESIEAQYALLTGKLPVLSVAQINSCTPSSYECNGCSGGDNVQAWRYLANKTVERPTILKSVTENWAYPIPVKDWFFQDQPAGTKTSACADTSKNWKTPTKAWFAELTAAGVSGFGMVDSNSPTGGPAAQLALRDVGPQSVSVAAGGWQWYESGVYMNTNTSGTHSEWGVDHAVQMVGYGYDKGVDENYWIVRNSWSTLWGEDGFIRLWRAKEGQPEPCGPASLGAACGTSGVLNEVAYPIVFEADPTHFA